MADLHFRSATELALALKRKEISSLELTDHFIERIERHDETINAVVVRTFDAARDAARAADAAQARGESLGPLHGVPVTIKEAYDLAGTPTTWGVPELADNVATSDAATVTRLKVAGAHFLGKTNVPLNLADFQSYNDIYGTTNNPWDTGRTPGGSSGGSAAALAAGFSGLESGSDIGGSIRNPAHFCGVYGHKPTWGVVSAEGHAPPGMVAPPDIAVVGPLARSAEDLALALDVVAGPDAFSSPGWELRLPRPQKKSLAEFRIALWAEDDALPTSKEVAGRVRRVGELLREQGATVSEEARPPFAGYGLSVEQTLDTYHSLLWGVMAAGAPEEQHQQLKSEIGKIASEDRSVHAHYVRGAVQDHRRWSFHNNQRYRIRQAWSQFFTDWDILICPQMPTAAFPHDHGSTFELTMSFDGRTIEYMAQLSWAGLITVAHLPSTVFPTGLSDTGLPIGLQAVGREFDDYRTIDFCRLLAKELGGFTPPPAFS